MGTEDETELTLTNRAAAAAGAAVVAACIVNPLDVIKTRIQAQAMAESSGQRQGCTKPWTCTSTLYEHAAQHPHSSLYHHHTHGLSDCQHQQHQHSANSTSSTTAARQWQRARHIHTLCPTETACWLAHSSSCGGGTGSGGAVSSGVPSRCAGSIGPAAGSSSSSSCSATAAADTAAAAIRSAAADKAAAAAALFRRWGITEGPTLPIRRTPPFPVPLGWSPAPVTATATATAAAAALNPAAASAVASSVSAAGAGAGGAARGAAAAAAGVLPASALAAGASCQCLPQQPFAAAAAAAAASLSANNNSMWEMAKTIRAREGLPLLWRGTQASMLIAMPMVGIYMPLYDVLLDKWSSKMGSLAPVVSGTAARTVACFCVAPFELIRTRLQASAAAGVSMRSTLTNWFAEQQHPATQQPLKQQQQQLQAAPQPRPQRLQAAAPGGAAAAAAAASTQLQLQPQQQQIRPAMVLRAVPRMWTGFSATLVRDVPFSALYWALVEPLRRAMLPVNSHWPPLQRFADKIRKPPHHSSSSSSSTQSSAQRVVPVPPSQQHTMHHSQLEILIANMVSGFIAGGLAAGATTPFDVVKTRMQIASPSQQQQMDGGSSTSGIRVFRVLRDVYHKEGLEGLFTGLKPRAARAAPACAIVISVYELLKSYLTPE